MIIDPLETTMNALKDISIKEYSTLETNLLTIAGLLPKKSKSLSMNFLKKIFSTNDNIILILLGHLYIERLLNEIIIKVDSLAQSRGNDKLNTFYKKIIFLKKEKIIEDNIADDIIIMNVLRNCFAHELNYQLLNFDPWILSKLKKYQREDVEPKNKKNKEVFIRIILKMYFFNILKHLSSEFRFLHLIKEQ